MLFLIMRDLILIIGAGALAGLWHYCIRLRKQIESLQVISERVADLEHLRSNYSYRLDVNVEPDWMAILEKIADENQIKLEPYIKQMKKDLKIIDGVGLAGKRFSFTSFYNGLTNQELIWSEHLKTFVKDFEIFGRMFENEDHTAWYTSLMSSMDENTIKKYEDSPFGEPIKISPWGIGLEIVDPHVGGIDVLGPKRIMSAIPFELLGTFFLRVGIETGGTNWIVKKFPKKIEDELSKENIRYEAWVDSPVDHSNNQSLIENKSEVLQTDSNWLKNSAIELFKERTDCHRFIGQYCAVSMSLEVTIQDLDRRNCVGALPTFWFEELNA